MLTHAIVIVFAGLFFSLFSTHSCSSSDLVFLVSSLTFQNSSDISPYEVVPLRPDGIFYGCTVPDLSSSDFYKFIGKSFELGICKLNEACPSVIFLPIVQYELGQELRISKIQIAGSFADCWLSLSSPRFRHGTSFNQHLVTELSIE